MCLLVSPPLTLSSLTPYIACAMAPTLRASYLISSWCPPPPQSLREGLTLFKSLISSWCATLVDLSEGETPEGSSGRSGAAPEPGAVPLDVSRCEWVWGNRVAALPNRPIALYCHPPAM